MRSINPDINIIVAYANHRIIGSNGSIPWSVPGDTQYFKKITMGHTVVMGRKTFYSLGSKPLPNRRNIVLSRTDVPGSSDISIINDYREVLRLPGKIFIIGGEEIYKLYLDVAERLYITEIELDVEGNTRFPVWDRRRYMLISEQDGPLDKEKTRYTFYVYQKRK